MTEPQLRPLTELYIRPASIADAPAINRICLLSIDAGKSAEALHAYPELPGLYYADPYLHLPSTAGFVLVDPARDPGDDAIAGYILTAADTRAFEHAARTEWFPRVSARYPERVEDVTGATEADKHYLGLLHDPLPRSDAQVAFSPAHMHINLRAEYQRRGWGRRLVARMIAYLREECGLERVTLGIDSRNDDARKFYGRLGFRQIQGAPVDTFGLEFKEFQG